MQELTVHRRRDHAARLVRPGSLVGRNLEIVAPAFIEGRTRVIGLEGLGGRHEVGRVGVAGQVVIAAGKRIGLNVRRRRFVVIGTADGAD